MAILTKAQLKAENSSSFPNNNSQAITPQILRDYNVDIIDTLVDSNDTGSFAGIDLANTFSATNTFTATNNFTSISASSFVSASAFTGDGSRLTNITASIAIPILDEGILQGYSTALNFSGSNISASLTAGVATISVNTNNLVTTSSFNTFTQSVATTSASVSTSIINLNASSASQQVSINALNVYTASQSSASIVNSITSLNSFSASALIELSNLESTTASLNTSITNLNSFTSSQNTKNTTLAQYTGSINTFTASTNTSLTNINTTTASQQVSINAINAVSNSWVTESETGSFTKNIYATANPLQFEYNLGNGGTNSVTLVAPASLNTGSFVTTASFNSYTSSNNQRVSSLETNSASVNTSISALNTYTASQSTASLVTSITNLNTFSASALVSISNINSTTASLNTSVTNLNSATASLFTSASLALVTASFDTGTRNLTFTKGNTTQFSVNIPDVSGSAGTFVTTSSFNAYTQSNDQRVSSLETNSASVNISITNINSTTASLNTSVTNLNQFTASQSTASLVTSITNLNTFSASALVSISNLNTTTASLNSSVTQLNASSASQQVSIDNLNAATSSYIKSSQTSSMSVATASIAMAVSTSISTQNLQHFVTFVDNSTGTQAIYVDGGIKYNPNQDLLLVNNITSSGYISASSLNLTGTLTASLASGYVWVGNGSNITTLVATSSFAGTTDLTALNQATASLQQATASLQSSTASLNTFSASALVSLANLNTTTASLNTSVTNLNQFTSSQLTINTGYNTFTASTNTSLSNLNTTTASLNTFTSSVVLLNANNRITGSQIMSGSLTITGSAFGNVVALSITSNTASMDLSLGNYFTLTLANTATTHISASNVQPGTSATLVITTGTNSSASLAPTMLQPSGSAYSATAGSGKKDVLSIVSVSTGVPFVVSTLNMI